MRRWSVSLLLILFLGVPAWAVDVGIFQTKAAQTCAQRVASPVTGQSWCFDADANALKLWNGTAWVSVVGAQALPAYAFASLPTAGTAGRLARVTDNIRGVWLDTGTQWKSVTGSADVKDFGALGNGSHNDTDEIQAAIDAVNTLGGGTVSFTAATYNHTGLTLKSNVYLVGKGRNSTYLTFTPATGNGIIGSGSYSAIKGLTIDATTTTGWGIKLTSFASSVIEDFGVQGSRSGIYLGTSINSVISRGGVSGNGGALFAFAAGSIGIQVGDDGVYDIATTTQIKDTYVSGFEKGVLNHHTAALVIDKLVIEDALIALENRTQTVGSLYTEAIAAFTWTNGTHAYVGGEAVHGGTSGATGTVSAAYTTAWAATGYMVLNNLVGTWVVGENILDSGDTTIAQVAAIGYSINDIGGDSSAPYGVDITPVVRPDGFSHVRFAGLGASVSIANWRRMLLAGRVTTNQTIATNTETDIIFNQSNVSAMMVFDAAAGTVKVRTTGYYQVNVNVTIVTTTDVGATYRLRVYDGATLIGYTQMRAPLATTTNFKITYTGFHDIAAGRVIKATLWHNDTGDKDILKDSDYKMEYTSLGIVGM